MWMYISGWGSIGRVWQKLRMHLFAARCSLANLEAITSGLSTSALVQPNEEGCNKAEG